MKDLSIMVDSVRFNYRVGLLIKKGNQILIECNDTLDYSVFPGGRVKLLEDSLGALMREIKEEMHLSLDKEKCKLKALLENFYEYDDYKVHEMYILYEIELEKDFKNIEDGMRNMDSDTNYYRWVDFDKIRDVKMLPDCLYEVVESNKFINKVERSI